MVVIELEGHEEATKEREHARLRRTPATSVSFPAQDACVVIVDCPEQIWIA